MIIIPIGYYRDNSKVVNVLQIQMKSITLIYQLYLGWEVNDG
jgi:hypothetical protein